MGKKILMFILGLLVLIGGIYCVARPGLTYLSMVWVIGFVMFFHAIEDIVTYGERKRLGIADGWNLAGAIIACLCGLAIIISGQAELVTGATLLYFLFVWLISAGIVGIIGAFKLRKHKETGIPAIDSFTGRWGWYVVLGILMILAGCFGFAHPILTMLSIGWIVGIDIMVAGIDMMVRAFTIATE
ncbi:MAG: DUF308 domain-containing protein [Lachnospiraceae bacterium]|nr:DUF308 domain-containing protein [Lachnospiraceae bacterium]MBQ8970478.1 DUF308 domain-containing protein [Lachnospiraceae bacterium]MBR2275501.1 DUF308 domain-containing protein [Lachnospiraceae bacterium]